MVLFTIVAANVNATLRKLYLHVVLHQRIAFHETTLSSGTVSLALSTHSNAVRSGLAEKFGLTLKSMSTVVAALVVAIASEWKLALVTATIIPAAILAIGITSAFDEKKERSLNQVKAEAATIAEEVVSSMRTVRALGAEEKLAHKYRTFLKQATTIGWQRLPIAGTQVGSYMFVLYGGYALAFWYGMHLYASGEAKSSGTIITTLFSIMIGVHAFSELAGHLGEFMRIRSAGGEIFKIIDSAPQEPQPGIPNTEHSDSNFTEDMKSGIFTGTIAFNDVSFHYPTRPGVQALDKFCLSIPAGKTTALVGPSGSGKSTVVGLLLRWYDVTAGEVSCGGHNIDQISFATLRANIGLVQQVRHIFYQSDVFSWPPGTLPIPRHCRSKCRIWTFRKPVRASSC